MKYTQSEAKGPSTSASRLVGRRAREWVVLMEESCMLNGVGARIVLRRGGRSGNGIRGPLTNEEDRDDQDHDDTDIHSDIHEVPIKLFVRHFGEVGKFRAGREHAPRTRNDPDREVGFQR